MASTDGLSQESSERENLRMDALDLSENEDDEDDENDETWDEMDTVCENYLNCLFCVENFKTMAVALEHCKTSHNVNLSALKSKFNMDCYSYICMINYIRREKVSPEMLLSFKEPTWLSAEYLTPTIQDDPWLMLDFEDLESPIESGRMTPDENYHVVNSENGLVTLTEQHFAQLQQKIKHLSLEVQSKEEALSIASEQIHKMKAVTQNLVCGDSVDESEFGKKVVNVNPGDNGYFSSYSHFGIHLEMLSDTVRTSKYRNAILNNSHLIRGKLVLDVGCGTAILSMFSAAAGAKKVYGVDKSEIIYHAMDIIRENNLEEKIDLVHAKVEEASIERVDVIVSEWMGYFLLYEGMLSSLIVARNRFLKEGGILLPNRCALYLTGISDHDTHGKYLGFWSNIFGFRMSCLASEVLREAHVLRVPPDAVATTAALVLELNLYTVGDESTDFSSDFCLESLAEGHVTALAGYFDAFFDLAQPEVLSTSPKSEETHWRHTVFFLEKPIPVSIGSLIRGRIVCRKAKEDDRALLISIALPDQQNDYLLS